MSDVTTDNIDARYLEALSGLKQALKDTIWTSVQSHGFKAGERRYWSSVLLVRICSIGRSMLRLCPDVEQPDQADHWDFASVAAIARGLFECCMFFRYFSTKVSEDEWLVRLNLMQLHDCSERIRMFSVMGNLDEVEGFKVHAVDLRQRLSRNPFFQSLDPKFQKNLLQGHRASLFSLNELVSQYVGHETFWYIYQILSSHVHSLPQSFYRTSDHNRSGIENPVDKAYISMSMEMATEVLRDAVTAYRDDFSDLVTFEQLGAGPSNLLLAAPKDYPEMRLRSDRKALCPCGSGQKYRWCHGKK